MHPWRPIAVVNQALCQGCSACVAVCPNKACSVRNFDTAQVLAMMDALL
jgi:heterodisulfide reductase subunit A